MHQLSTKQALSIWSELEQAYYDDNSWGGDLAEIYIYRLLPYRPGNYKTIEDALNSPILGGDIKAEYQQANQDLYDLLVHFAQQRNVIITVNDQKLKKWLKSGYFTHRVHVKVIHKNL
jgi:hypothetical protein